MSLFDEYAVKLTLQRPMLATNPSDPHVVDQHIISKQRRIILEKSKVNTAVNKYLDALELTPERGTEEIEKLIARLERMTGYELSQEEREKVLAGDVASLSETFAEAATTGTTIFYWDEIADKPCIGDHMILGFLKAASEAIGRARQAKKKASAAKAEKGVVLESIAYTQSLINQHVRVKERFIPFDRDIMRDDHGVPMYLQRSLRAMTAQGPRIALAKSEQIEEGATLSFTLQVLKDSPITEKHLRDMFDYGELCGLGQWRNARFGSFANEIKKL